MPTDIFVRHLSWKQMCECNLLRTYTAMQIPSTGDMSFISYVVSTWLGRCHQATAQLTDHKNANMEAIQTLQLIYTVVVGLQEAMKLVEGNKAACARPAQQCGILLPCFPALEIIRWATYCRRTWCCGRLGAEARAPKRLSVGCGRDISVC